MVPGSSLPVMADPEHNPLPLGFAEKPALASSAMDISSGISCHENEDVAALSQSDFVSKGEDQSIKLCESSVGKIISNKASNNGCDKQEDANSKQFGFLKEFDEVSLKILGGKSSYEVCLPSVSCSGTDSEKDMISKQFDSVKEKGNKLTTLDGSLSEKVRLNKSVVKNSGSQGVNLEPKTADATMNRQSSMSKLNAVGSDLESRVSVSVLNRQSSMSRLNAEAPVFVPKGLVSFSISPGAVSSPRSPNPSLLSSATVLQSSHLGATQGVHPLLQQLETYSASSGLGFHAVKMPVSMAAVLGAGSSPSFSAGASLATRLSGTISASRSLQPIGSASEEHFSTGFTSEHGKDADLFPSQEMVSNSSSAANSAISEDLKSKIAKQVEFYFSDSNLPTDNYLMKFVKKDPEGFVPIPVVASFRKVKFLSKNHTVVAAALRTSSFLVVSEDGKKVRRAEPLPDIDLDEIQLRTVVAENLPEDHSIQNMEQLFGTVGNVKLVRICQPEAANGMNQTPAKFSRTDLLVSNKLHALVEYESVEEAERAVAELTDERNWRSGLRVRLLVRRTFQGKHGYQHLTKGRKFGAEAVEGNETEEDGVTCNGAFEKLGDEPSQHTETSEEHLGDIGSYERDGGRRGRGRNRGRGRVWGQHSTITGLGHSTGTSPQSSSPLTSDFVVKPPPGPRMPDGTRGFTMGRGRLLCTEIS